MTDTTTHRAAVLGQPIGHSRSPVLHNAGYAALGLDHWAYDRFDCDADALPGLVGGADLSYRGFSVTMPAKFAALAFADESTERARRIGSANTLVRTDTGWRADNTDVDGIRGALAELLGGGDSSTSVPLWSVVAAPPGRPSGRCSRRALHTSPWSTAATAPRS